MIRFRSEEKRMLSFATLRVLGQDSPLVGDFRRGTSDLEGCRMTKTSGVGGKKNARNNSL